MARMNLDEKMRNDPRIKKLARHLKEVRFTTWGRLIAVWWLCYDSRSPLLLIEDADDAAELDGFAEAMAANHLATAVDEHTIRVAGVEDRIQYLLKKAKAAQAGGEARAVQMAADGRGPGGRARPRPDQPPAGDSQPPAGALAGGRPATGGPASSPLSPSPDPDHPLDLHDQPPAGDSQPPAGEDEIHGVPVAPGLAPELAAALGKSLSSFTPFEDAGSKERTRRASLEQDDREERQQSGRGRAGVPPREPGAYRRNGTEVIR